MAVKEGMSRELALRALTINGAEMMDIAHRVQDLVWWLSSGRNYCAQKSMLKSGRREKIRPET